MGDRVASLGRGGVLAQGAHRPRGKGPLTAVPSIGTSKPGGPGLQVGSRPDGTARHHGA